MKFNSGKIVVTCGVDNEMNNNKTFAQHVRLSLERHMEGIGVISVMKAELRMSWPCWMAIDRSRLTQKLVYRRYGSLRNAIGRLLLSYFRMNIDGTT